MLAGAADTGARSEDLLDGQRRVLEMIVRGCDLRATLTELCLLVEAQAEQTVRAAILLADDQENRLYTGAAPNLPDEYKRAVDGIVIEPGVGTCVAAAAKRAAVVTSDIAADPGWQQLKHLPLGLGLRAAWSLPILSSSGSVLGTFGTYFPETREPSPEERRLVEVLARTAALAIERTRSDDVLRRSGENNRFLADLALATQQLIEPHDLMTTAARMLTEHLRADRCAYAEVEEERVFVINGEHTHGVASIIGRWPVAAFGPECVRDMLEGRPFVVHDVEATPSIGTEHMPAYRATEIGAVICVPLHKEGKFTAAMAVHQKVARNWLAAEVELVSLVVARCWEALERARVSRTLRESEARYRAMVEASPECVKLVAADGTLLQMNASGLRMVGARAEREVIGRSVYDVIAPEHREAFRAFNERVCRGEGGMLSFEVLGLDGARRFMESTAVALRTSSGEYAQLAVTRDVSERTRADLALAESRARLDYAVRLSGVGFWYCDLPFDELIWDARVREHFFMGADERVTIDDFYARIHPDDREVTRAAIDRSIQERTSYDVMYRTQDPMGDAFKWVRALGGTAYSSDGAPLRFDGVTVDVTSQRLAQERLARSLERERAQARLLQKLAQAALTIHAAASLDEVLQTITEQARAIIGAHQAVTSQTTGDLTQAIHCVSLSEKYASYRAYDSRPSGEGIYGLVCRSNLPLRLTQAQLEAHPAWRSFSGEQRAHPPLRGWLAAPFVGRDGSNLGLVQLSDKLEGDFDESDEAVLVQLAQIASVAIENARLYDQLREQDRRKSEFLATLAHELRNPLAPIRTGLAVLRSHARPAQVDKAHEMMERQLSHMVRMVDDLLDISRITLGKVALQKQRLDLRSALHGALETTRPLVEASAHELALRLSEEPLWIEADGTRIAQVLANLINNAAKYTLPGGRIAITAERDGEVAVVRITDNGVGIPAESLAAVFEMFAQVGHSIERSQGGLGIGLTLARRLVEMHEGTIDAHSEGAGKGTVLTVRLPLATRASAEEADVRAPEQPPTGRRILVVDDNEDAAESLGMLLELSGHEIRLAHTGLEALRAASEFAPDVVFLDIGLPELNGYEVARRLRADATLKQQPYLFALTGWGTEDDRRKAREAGFDRHLVKPFDATRIDELLREAKRTA